MTGTDRVKDKDGNVTSVRQIGLQFCLAFDRACRKCFLLLMTRYQDYTQPPSLKIHKFTNNFIILLIFKYLLWKFTSKEVFIHINIFAYF